MRHEHYSFAFVQWFFYFIFLAAQVLVAARGFFAEAHTGLLLSRCSSWTPEHVVSDVAACRLSCCSACGILDPRPGTESLLPALEGRFFNTLIHLFMFGCAGSLLLQGLLSSCSMQSSHCSGISRCGARARRHPGFRSCSTWAQQLWLLGSRAQAQ